MYFRPSLIRILWRDVSPLDKIQKRSEAPCAVSEFPINILVKLLIRIFSCYFFHFGHIIISGHNQKVLRASASTSVPQLIK
jgi:hypothetical protein